MKFVLCSACAVHCLGVLLSTAYVALGQPQQKQAALTLKVVDPWGNPVACELRRIAPNSIAQELLGHTDYENPSITIPDGCARGCKLLFHPDAASVYYDAVAYCPYTKDTFTVTPIETAELKKLATSLTALKDDSPIAPAKISFAASEIADRTKNKGVKEAYSLQSYVEAAKFLGASTAVAYDPKQKKIVPSTELQAKVEEFQKNNGLKKTGSLDYQTLRAASGLTTNDLLRND